MRLSAEFIQLPLLFDADRLRDEVQAIDEADWRPHPQGFAGNSALPLIAAGGDPLDDAVEGPMGPTPVLQRLPYLRQVLATFGCALGRSRLMRLDGNAEVGLHTDIDYYWQQRVRIHVPVVTTPTVRFHCGEREVHMQAGECWVFDTGRLHNVINAQPTRRIHLVVDTVGSGRFWSLVDAGRNPFVASDSAFEPLQAPFQRGAEPALQFEQVNQPNVMGPWELRSLLDPLLTDLAEEFGGAPVARELRALLEPWQRDWANCWAVHGDRRSGRDAYRRLRAQALAQLQPFRGRATLQGSDIVLCIERGVLRPALSAAYEAGIDGSDAPAERSSITTGFEPAVAATFSQPPPRRSQGRAPGRGAVIIVSPPRSGSTLLFETLAQSPSLCSIGGESHALIEGIAALTPAAHGWSSNRLTAADATPDVIGALRQAFGAALRRRDGGPPVPGQRMLEKTPKNALRIPLLARVFPEARFLYLHRDHRQVISSMLEAWRSGRFVTYPELPGWRGPPWSLLLVPGWHELADRPLAEIVVQQWCRTMQTLLDDLDALPATRVVALDYRQLTEAPGPAIEAVCDALGLDWDQPFNGPLPHSRFTVSAPSPEKWRSNEAELSPHLDATNALFERAGALLERSQAGQRR